MLCPANWRSVQGWDTILEKPAKADLPEMTDHKGSLVQDGETGESAVGKAARVEAVMRAAECSNLLSRKSTRIDCRISPRLLEKAKKQTGIHTDIDLIEFALANVALDDDFGRTFEKVRGLRR